jgi:hypothetical protein
MTNKVGQGTHGRRELSVYFLSFIVCDHQKQQQKANYAQTGIEKRAWE